MTPTDPDVALMLRVREGDTEALRELIERHQHAVINTIHRAIGDANEAEDLAQRVFVQVYRSAKRYKPTAKFTTWLFTITRNTILNEHRRRSRHPAESLDALQEPRDSESAGWQAPDTTTPDPAQEAVERELQALLSRGGVIGGQPVATPKSEPIDTASIGGESHIHAILFSRAISAI